MAVYTTGKMDTYFMEATQNFFKKGEKTEEGKTEGDPKPRQLLTPFAKLSRRSEFRVAYTLSILSGVGSLFALGLLALYILSENTLFLTAGGLTGLISTIALVTSFLASPR